LREQIYPERSEGSIKGEIRMKKTIGLFVAVLFLTTSFGVAMAAQRGTPEYEKLKEYKKAQRAKKESAPATKSAVSEFWKKEGDRSGLSQTGSTISTFFQNLNPTPFLNEKEKQYNARKGQTVK
jgi:hypothetical protein